MQPSADLSLGNGFRQHHSSQIWAREASPLLDAVSQTIHADKRHGSAVPTEVDGGREKLMKRYVLPLSLLTLPLKAIYTPGIHT